jgi:AcrR family transcriptional regulator
MRSTVSKRPPSANWVRRDDRRSQLLGVAARLVATRGLTALTMENLAAEAGINKAVVYRSYPNRGAVLLALFDQELNALAAAVDAALGKSKSLAVALPGVVHLWFDAVERTGDLLTAMLTGPTADPDLSERRQQWHRDATATWAEAVAEATGADLVDATDAVTIVLGGLHHAVARWREDRQPRARIEARFIHVALAALQDLDVGRRECGGVTP